MRLAALYDIHGNLPALEAVLAEARDAGVDRLVVGGDVFPGPMAVEAFHLLHDLELPVSFIRGNCDRNLIEIARSGTSKDLPDAFVPLFQWQAAQLNASELDVIATWPLTTQIEASGVGAVLFCHATPRDDNEIFTESTPIEQISSAFAKLDARTVICGHTHRQFERTIGDVRMINAGSVGMPGNRKDAEWLLVADRIELRRTSYDLGAAAERMRRTTYPGLEQFLAAIGAS